MLNKYNDLINMLIARGYNVSEFEELGEEYSAIIDNNTNIFANIYLEDTIEIYIFNKEKDDECIESRNYVNSKYAYNFIKKYLED
ncbi:MAG: hypothetical protein SOZ95_05295 [Bacilli bacterium]|nr:hypothetical protein [Bacilli bacterium]